MLLSMLAVVAVAVPKYDVFLGMSAKMKRDVQGMVQTMTAAQGFDWRPEVAGTVPVGRDTLVMWAWPLKWTHGIGLQVYGPDGRFKVRLDDSNLPSARATVCAGRYVVGGGNTLRVWDARQNYRPVRRRVVERLDPFARLSCLHGILRAESIDGLGQVAAVQRFTVPELRPLP